MKPLSNKHIKDYILGRCTARQMEEIAAWASLSQENERTLFRLKDQYLSHKFANIFSGQPRVEEAEAALFRTIRESEKRSRRGRIVRLMRYAAMLVAVLLLGGVSLYALWEGPEMVHVRTAAHAVKRLTLPDGTQVWLNGASELTYPAEFSSDERSVNLCGEALFEVTKNPRRPFIVKSDAVQIRVLGTKFNMNTRSTDHTEEVSLIEGQVEVKELGTENKLRLIPNQKVRVDKIHHHMEIESVYAPLDALWHDGLIPFDNIDLKGIAAILEKAYRVHICIEGPAPARTYSGVVKYRKSIQAVLRDLSYTIPFETCVQTDGTIMLCPL